MPEFRFALEDLSGTRPPHRARAVIIPHAPTSRCPYHPDSAPDDLRPAANHGAGRERRTLQLPPDREVRAHGDPDAAPGEIVARSWAVGTDQARPCW
jgi:hypothetical protein